jgi:hypothetical protein
MEVFWAKDIKSSLLFDCECKPMVWNDYLYYAFSCLDSVNRNGYSGKKITVMKINLNTQNATFQDISFKYEKHDKKLLPSRWEFKVFDNQIFLYIGFWLDLNYEKIQIANHAFKWSKIIKKVCGISANNPTSVNFDYSPKEETRSDYIIGNKILKYNRLSTIKCFDKLTNKESWKIKMKGYLYTDIEKRGQYLFFGTAGKGGAFYCVDFEIGNIVTEYSNGNARYYAWYKDMIVIPDKKSNLSLFNPIENKIIETLILKREKFNFPILIENDYIYTVVYNPQKGTPKLVCIKP